MLYTDANFNFRTKSSKLDLGGSSKKNFDMDIDPNFKI